jgi:hypothetical protein
MTLEEFLTHLEELDAAVLDGSELADAKWFAAARTALPTLVRIVREVQTAYPSAFRECVVEIAERIINEEVTP